MIPTLSGRIQTRLFLFVVLGLPITLVFALSQTGWVWDWGQMQVFFLFLATITVLGLILDPVYIALQRLRWDRDWPFAFQFFFSIVEFAIVLALAVGGFLPWLDGMAVKGQPASVDAWVATRHFLWVFIPSYLALLGPISAFFIRWRFKAAQFGKL